MQMMAPQAEEKLAWQEASHPYFLTATASFP